MNASADQVHYIKMRPGPVPKLKPDPCKNDKTNGLPKMIKRMIRQMIHVVTSKSINNQKKVNDTLERIMLTV